MEGSVSSNWVQSPRLGSVGNSPKILSRRKAAVLGAWHRLLGFSRRSLNAVSWWALVHGNMVAVAELVSREEGLERYATHYTQSVHAGTCCVVVFV